MAESHTADKADLCSVGCGNTAAHPICAHCFGELVSENPPPAIELRRLRDRAKDFEAQALRDYKNAGPYKVIRWTDNVQHADPCDCDPDREWIGDECMANSEWVYMLACESGEWYWPLVRLPQRPPQREDDLGEAVIDTWPKAGT